MYVDNKPEGGLVFNTWNIGSCYISSTQANGLIDTVFREYELTAQQAIKEFGIENVSDRLKRISESKPDSKHRFIHAIYP